MSAITGSVAVVTGAGSGIGRELAIGLARRGARLAISDVNDVGLAETAAQTRARGAVTRTDHVDVSDRDAVRNYAAAVVEHYGVVNQIYNNAGIAAAAKTVLDSDYEDYERILGVNLWGVIHGTKEFLPHLIASGAGHVVNISSLNGIMAQDSLSGYCISKFGVRGFTESLRQEMATGGHPVQVTVVHPGGVRTNIASAAIEDAERRGVEVTDAERERSAVYTKKLLKLPADRAAKIILDGVEANKGRVMVGRDAKLVDGLVRLTPAHYPRLIALWTQRLFGRQEPGADVGRPRGAQR